MYVTLQPPTAAEFKALYDQTGWANWTTEQLQKALDASWIVASARDAEGALVGVARVISDGIVHAFVADLIVDERSRGEGVGAAVLDRLVTESTDRGVTQIKLFAASGRAPFYERNQFRRRPDDAPGMDFVAA